MTYEQRRNDLAEKMAKVDSFNMRDLADIVLKEMLNAFMLGAGSVPLNQEAENEGREQLDYLLELGLTPPQEKL